MRRVQRFVCDECKREHPTIELAERCEGDDRTRKKEQAARIKEEEAWQEQGHDIWRENGVLNHAKRVDPDKYGSHDYGHKDGTSDCNYHCGCWMGPAHSGGPIDPFGACPENPIEAGATETESSVDIARDTHG